MKDPRIISTNGPENFWSYRIPTYRVTDNGIEDFEETIITHIEDALFRIGKRADDRKRREVQGTYLK